MADKTKGPDTPEGKMAFRMNPEGVGRLFTATYKSGAVGVPTESLSPVPIRGAGMTVDGPMPEFYEPIESPTANLLHPEAQNNPCAKIVSKEFGKPDAYPYVLTTYGVVEHFCAGVDGRKLYAADYFWEDMRTLSLNYATERWIEEQVRKDNQIN